ncbi:hypothetical protein [Stenotrophomonas sp. TWI809]|uniref:hypothetical protein n=1 Tax=Stenotrophomonas sp. TWI809 TaxID=3136796 RepID=UPI003208B620
MTLVKNPDCFNTYTSPAICDQVRATLLPPKQLHSRLVTYLGAYLELTGQRLHADERGSEEWRKAALGFIGALYSPRFADISHYGRYNHSRIFINYCTDLDEDFPRPRLSLSKSVPQSTQQLVTEFEDRSIDEERETFWKGWTLVNRRGKTSYLGLHQVHGRYGVTFCNDFHNALQQWYRQTVLDGPIGINAVVSHLTKQPDFIGADDFRNSAWMTHFTRDLFVSFFKESHANSNAMRVIKRQWAELARTLERHILGVIWANPDTPIPIPPTPRVPERMLRVKRSEEGDEYKSKLLTDIPLNIPDRAAKELIYSRFKSDLKVVESWAKARCARVIAGQRLRDQLTAEMRADLRPRILDNLPKNFTQDEAIEAAAERFEARAMPHICAPRRKSLNDAFAAETLGIATALDLMAYSTLLILRHPAITPALLEELEIVDLKGRPQGIIELDGSAYLVGLKRRKGSDLAEQRIALSHASKEILDEIVRITSTHRAIMKCEGNDHWRRLLLYCATPHRPINIFNAVKHATTFAPRLAEEFRSYCESDEHARQLAQRFSLSTLRSSAGTLVYLETGSPHAMSKALGHDAYSPRLLDHYLPRVMREFFEERWIRTVQTSIICQALVGSNHQLPASGFKSVKELEDFMRLHAFVAPHRGQDSDRKSRHNSRMDTPGTLIFNVDQQVMITLVSLQIAVATSPESYCDKAHWWADLAGKIRPDLESRPDLAPILAKAIALADPRIVEGIAYA